MTSARMKEVKSKKLSLFQEFHVSSVLATRQGWNQEITQALQSVFFSFILYLLGQAAVKNGISILIRFRSNLAVKLGSRIIIHCIKNVYL